jgi:hypothetical protein
MEKTQPIEHSNALRKESSGREKKTRQSSQQKWQAFSRQPIFIFLFFCNSIVLSNLAGLLIFLKEGRCLVFDAITKKGEA